MTSEGTDTLISAFTSITGQPVAHCTHQIILFGFFYQRMDIFMHFISLISSSRHKGFAKRTKQRGIFAFLNQIFSSAQPAPVPGNTDLLYHISRLNKNPQHISCRVLFEALRPSQQFFSHVRTEPALPGYYQYFL